jgi:putative membrane protein
MTNRPTNDVTELAKERNRQASERTMTSWINASLLLIGFGVAIEEIPVLFNPGLSSRDLINNINLAYMLGLGTIAFGILLLIPASISHYIEIRSLKRDSYLLKPIRLNLLIDVSLVILFGLIAAVNLVLIVARR